MVCTWKWGGKYSQIYVDRLADGLRRYLRTSHQFRVFSPPDEDLHLTEMPGCFARLRMFSRDWQRSAGLEPGDQLVCLDLDIVIVRMLDLLFSRKETFVILGGGNSVNPCPYNGSVMMLTAGHHHELWDDFSVDAALRIRHHEFPDDQGWIWHKMGDSVATWPCGRRSGIYAFGKPGWPRDNNLPMDAKIVCFPGRRDPSMYEHLPWIRKHWTSLV